jgi:hypothetical protein
VTVDALCSVRDWGSKLPGATLRLAGLLHAAVQPDLSLLSPKIAVPILGVALELGRILTPHALAVFQLISEDEQTRNAKRILKWLLRQGSAQVSKRDCHRAFQNTVGKVEDFNKALETLRAQFMIRVTSWDTASKRGELIEINPALVNY